MSFVGFLSLFHSFHFLRPWWFLLIIPSIVLLIMMLRVKTVANNWSGHCDPHLLKHLLVGKQTRKRSILPVMIFLLWCIGVVALAGPTWSQYPQPVYQKVAARVIALDVSQTMNANDVLPTRLKRARFKVLDLLKRIKEGQTGMIVFSGEPFVVSPLTADTNTIANMVPFLNSNIVPVSGDNIQKALVESAKLIKQTGFSEGQIILVTDSTPSSRALVEAQNLAKEGIKTSVLAVGTAQGGPIKNNDGGFVTDKKGQIVFANMDATTLQKLAISGDGQFSLITDNDQDVARMLSHTDSGKTQKTETQKANALWKDEGHWLVWLLIILVALIARKGWLEKVCR
ncbi:vWA domain-containing protein [Cysteiniphilum halobium]|uniref:vWA domain-containing protein n=1 Tax=Cysteiniphilum halobium TaxID=2219059 RepID=UPI000E6537E1|nr:VWA domain-containing protein [Cysteiniphilum halobium]